MGRRKLSDLVASGEAAPVDKNFQITSKEAEILVRIGVSQVKGNDLARRLLKAYLDSVLAKDVISDEDAKTSLSVLGLATTTTHKGLCDQVLNKYMAKFDLPVKSEGPVKA